MLILSLVSIINDPFHVNDFPKSGEIDLQKWKTGTHVTPFWALWPNGSALAVG
jgi:hypothetical protein